MKNKLLTIFLFLLTLNLSAQNKVDSQNDTIYTLPQFRQLALSLSKTVLISEEKMKIATELKKAAFTQFLPNFSANGTYMWNQKGTSMLHEDALLPVGTIMADGSFGFRQDQINNKWTMIDGQPVPLDSDGKPFNPKTEPGKIQWKDYAYLPKEAMEYDTRNIFAGGIGFTQPVFMGFKIRELYRISKTTEELSKISNDKVKQDLIVEVDEAYWRVVSLINKEKLALQYVELIQKLNNDVEAMLAEGVATKGDLLNVRVKLNETKMTLTKVENGVRLSKMALFELCGLPINGNYSLSDEDIQQTMIDDTSFDIEEVADRRAELRMLEKTIDIAKSNVNLAKSRFMPNVIVAGNYIVSNPNVFNGFATKFSGMFNASIVLNVPIFHFGDKIHTLKAAKSNYQIAQYQYERARELIDLQLNQYSFKITEANKQLETAISNIEAAQENLKLAKEAYSEGLINITTYLQAQTAWVSAISEKIDAGVEVRMCDIYLKKAKGIIEEK